MSTITREFTKEQLIARAKENRRALECFPKQKVPQMDLALFEIALASLEAEAAAYADPQASDNFKSMGGKNAACTKEWMWRNSGDGLIPVYTAPPATASMKDHQIRELVNELRDIAVEYHGTQQLRERIARTVRAAMLQGADGNSPVIPDGWVVVPVEPTEHMIVEGFESEPDESFSDPDVWEEYQAMSGCRQAAHRAKLCWAAMISAAPKPLPSTSSKK